MLTITLNWGDPVPIFKQKKVVTVRGIIINDRKERKLEIVAINIKKERTHTGILVLLSLLFLCGHRSQVPYAPPNTSPHRSRPWLRFMLWWPWHILKRLWKFNHKRQCPGWVVQNCPPHKRFAGSVWWGWVCGRLCKEAGGPCFCLPPSSLPFTLCKISECISGEDLKAKINK